MENNLTNVKEFEELARQALPKMYYDYFRGGAEDEFTLRENVEAFHRIRLNPRVLIDVSSINMSTSLLGFKLSAPILVAPTGGHKLAHPEGEVATARAAAACNTIMVLSFSSNCTIEEVAYSCNAVRFLQLYVYKQRDLSAKVVQRAESCGFKAIFLTVDTPRLGRREADIKNKMVAPKIANLEGLLSVDVNDGPPISNIPSLTVMRHVGDRFIPEEMADQCLFLKEKTCGSNLQAFANETLDPSLSWKDIAWLKSITKLPILIKGILTAEDARKAVDVGVSGIVVSNHGGRQLDYVPASISVLEEVVQAVSGAVPVLVDGGVRHGTDIFKAIALGAKAVMVGRPIVYGLAAKGELGVRNVIGMLKNELEHTMALAGCPNVEDISRMHVQTPADRLRSSI